ncbi:GNAT family N-acetyltransferase [Kocuria sp.]|uniref:GNAT family N-acetyltransferase n=1 Tax=Kocuria sp. TaxID=1871328 RepID=UPI0026DEDF08|nr:GNAT family N-acetyltransferase [Kocuria sp.]MDO5617976.1 GNAT family N-acetyltransferase [Kocuria sp.]
MTDPHLPLTTDRLVLRPYQDDDVERLLPIYSQPDVARYLLEEPWTEDYARAEVAKRKARTDLNSGERALNLIATFRGQPVAMVALWRAGEPDGCLEIGWTVDPAFSGRGFASEAAACILHHGLATPGVHRVEAQMDGRNSASARLAQRIGMVQEGHLRKNWWAKGEWTDTLVFASVEIMD